MKLETIQCLAPGELRRLMGELIAKQGSQNRAAREMGISHSMFHQVLTGGANPGRKFLDYFGLEMRRVIVKKQVISS